MREMGTDVSAEVWGALIIIITAPHNLFISERKIKLNDVEQTNCIHQENR